MLRIAIAHSIELDSQDAIKEVLEQCHKQLGDLHAQAGILFAGIDHNFELILNKINEIYPEIELIGCTTDGELSSVHGFTEDSIALTLFVTEQLKFKAGVADKISVDPLTNIKKAAEKTKLDLGQEPKLCITTPSSLTVDGEDVIDGFRMGLGKNFPIFGGSAGEQWRFLGTTYQFYNNNVFTDAAPFLLLSGPLVFSMGVESGWMPIGKKAKVNKAENNIVYKIGDLSALDFYKYYLGDSVGEGELIPGEYPLAVYEHNEESFYLRALIALDLQKGSITFAATVPEGATVQITHATRDKIINAATKSVNSAISEYPGSKPSVAICFTCASRKQVLGTRVKEEYMVLKDNFPDLPIVGFYTYGEIGPLKKDRPSRFHNETFCNLLIGIE